MGAARTISAAEFQATCLEVLDRVQTGELSRVEVTQAGKVVAVVTAPPGNADQPRDLFGFMRGSVIIPPEVDLTVPTSDCPSDAELGILHR
jgi:prevent-host-death family protein